MSTNARGPSVPIAMIVTASIGGVTGRLRSAWGCAPRGPSLADSMGWALRHQRATGVGPLVFGPRAGQREANPYLPR
jgi:hypothetical protein